MQYFRCLQKGRPASHCTKIVTKTKIEKQSDDNKSKLIKSSNPTKTSKAASITNISKFSY